MIFTKSIMAWYIIVQSPYFVLSVPVQAGDILLTSELVTNNLVAPVYLTHAPGDFDRLFVIEKSGLIRIIKDKLVLDKPFLDLTDVVRTNGNEQGLLGLAFHPDYAMNGLFYVNYTRIPDGATTIAHYQVTADPEVADFESAQLIITVTQPGQTHNGGWLDFSPLDGYLYTAIGDGGGGYDPDDDAQNLDVLLGKIIRVDVNCDGFPDDPDRNYGIPQDNPFVGKTGEDEIWAYGLRNPWRCSFDRETGELYIADVGQGTREELNFQPANSTGGENYGWDCKEGTLCTNEQTCDCADPKLVDPIFEYAHEGVNTVVIGGYVYRGCAIPDLTGAYIFADRRVNIGHPIWKLRHDNGKITDLQEIQKELDPGNGLSIGAISSFGEDAFGELYICDTQGHELFKIIAAVQSKPDCNDNGVPDACDIFGGTSADANNNGIPDECECPWDLDGSGSVGTGDLLALFAQWGTDGPADFDESGTVGTGDLLILFANWGPCP